MEFGYREYANKNGTLWFLVNDIEGLEVSYLTEEKNLHTGKMYTKRHDLGEYKTGKDNNTGLDMRLYDISIHAGDIELRAGDQVEVIKNSYDKKKWGL